MLSNVYFEHFLYIEDEVPVYIHHHWGPDLVVFPLFYRHSASTQCPFQRHYELLHVPFSALFGGRVIITSYSRPILEVG